MCRFYDYAPYIFNSIRQMAGITSEQYLASIGPERLVTGLLTGDVSTLAELCSPGKSGSFLYFTYDGNFIMKTISRAEYKTLLNSLRDYHDYLLSNPDSLITRYFGLHKIEMLSGTMEKKTYYFVMMKNIFRTQKTLKYKFDLKGSTYGREVPVLDYKRE
jgi:1-phosphatidylinositol-4-phosphate 5-kinase